MRRITLIVITLGIVLIIVFVWLYLFVYGTPQAAQDIFANFGIVKTNTNTTTVDTSSVVDTSPTTSNGEIQPLRQLTTKPVAGMTFVGDGTIRYIERGTGYMFSIDLASGVETQVTNTTHAKIIDAEISTAGTRVILATETATGIRESIGSIVKNDTGEGELQSVTLPLGAHDASFNADGSEVRYIVPTTNGSEAHAYTLSNESDRILFSIPFAAAHATWNPVTYIYTAPTVALTGYVYKVTGNTLGYIQKGGLGLTALSYTDGLIISEVTNSSVQSYALVSGKTYPVPIPVLPEKCADMASGALLCAAPLDYPKSADYPDAWYKGAVSLEDFLWKVNIVAGEATLLADPLTQIGRAIDVSKITANTDATKFLLVNKNDDTLWLFEPGV